MSDAVSVSLVLVAKVLTFLKKELSRDREALQDIKEIKIFLTTMKASLDDAEGWEGTSSMNHMMSATVGQMRDLAHEMEDVLDDFMIHAPRDYSDTTVITLIPLWSTVIQSKIARIKASMSTLMKSPWFEALVGIVHSREARRNRGGEPQLFQDDEIIGIDSPKQDLINLLTESTDVRKAISVVGPGGAGKTVLVTSVFKSKRVDQDQFPCRAWLSFSDPDNHEQRLQKLLSQFLTDDQHSPLGADTAAKLENYLCDKRYLVVLDGVRKDEEWSSIIRVLPDYSNGSRMIITTQYADVAGNFAVFPVKGLEWKDSWRLFCKKAYGNDKGECPDELLDLSETIVKRCECLPQPISAVGTLLSTKPKIPDEWRRVNANLAAKIQHNCINTMFLPSYYDLSSNQKSCLLYFSLFPEDYSIKREKLIRLWLSEGLVDESGTVPEEIAEQILDLLISRNLVEETSRDIKGRVKSCRVLNLTREFICQKSEENKFASFVTDRDVHQRAGTIHRRLSIENASSSLIRTERLNLDSVRSLFVYGLNLTSSKMEETLQRIRLLKVLDLENAHLDSFPESVFAAALLRYLSLRNTNVNMVPTNIEKLRYLEYLDLRQTQVTLLPREILSLHYLRHLLVYHCNPMKSGTSYGQAGVGIVGKMSVPLLPCIQKLSVIKVGNPKLFQCLRELTLLKKLGLDNLIEKDGVLLCSCIENMKHLSTLNLASSSREEKLDLQHMNTYPRFLRHLNLKGRLTILPAWIPSLNSLVRLFLRWSKLSDSPFEKLQKLPNLMELEMTDAFTGEFLSVSKGDFPSLRTLYIEQFDGLRNIEVCDGGMPMLRKLTIVRCMHLYELPSGIERLRGLKELLLYDMPEHLTRKLGKTSEERWKIDHVPLIHSFYVSANNKWESHNFS